MSLVVDVILKVTVVLVVAALAARLLSRRSAAARHQIWAVAMVASLLMPLLTMVSPQWTVAVLPASPALIETNSVPYSDSAVVGATHASPSTAPAADPVFDPIPSLTQHTSSEPQSMASVTTRLSTVTTIWLVGVLLVLARLAFGTVRVWWIARRATPATVWAPLGERLAYVLASIAT